MRQHDGVQLGEKQMVRFIPLDGIDKIALAHRRALGFRDDQMVDGMTLITKLKNRYPEFNYLRVPNGSLKDADAQWDDRKKLITITEATFVGMNQESPRSLFAVVHEVGHALLGHKGILNRGPSSLVAASFSANLKRMERQANSYAASFLMPDTQLLRAMTVEQIIKTYNVSREAARIRRSQFR
ncbi:MAG: ImmA/IrrE family metallo-endopeptidase [Xanthobacteraceae bacterium]